MARTLESHKITALQDIANKLRIHSIRATNVCNSGHPTSCCSAGELMSVLFFHTMRYHVDNPRDPSNDRFVLSKGHAAPILYAAWAEAGLFPVSDLNNLRKISSDLEGHPTPRLEFVDVATGSLGQGLSCAAGMAYTGKYWDRADYRVFCLVGDGESAEGSIWEALAFAAHYKLDNLVAVFDVNRLGQSDPTALQHQMDTYKNRLESVGWHTYVVDGHSVEEIAGALAQAESVQGKPQCILAKTFKGYGCPGVEDKDNFHGKPLGVRGEAAIAELTKKLVNKRPDGLKPPSPRSKVTPVNLRNIKLSEPPNYTIGTKVAIRAAYGNALPKLGKSNSRVVALDGDMKNSTFSQKFQDVFPDRFIECFIAEQNMVGVAIGCGTRERTVPFVSTFSCFLSRACDQIRLGAISKTNVNFVGSHCGVSIGEDGPSQMALEDLAMFRALPGSTVFYPGDAVACERAVELAANTAGICFVRVTRPDTPVIYPNEEPFQIGKAKIIRQSSSDVVTVIGAGITLHEAIKAADRLTASGINIRVLDPFTVKPIDTETILRCAKDTDGKILTVEDHYPEGGLGETVASAVGGERNVIVKSLSVSRLPRSGKSAELLKMYGIDADGIVKAVSEFMLIN